MADEAKVAEQASSEAVASDEAIVAEPGSSEQPAPEEPAPEQPAPTPNPFAGKGDDISPQNDGGVLKSVVTEGSGEGGPMEGDTVYVHYVGTLLDGNKFDSSRDRGEKFSFKLGKGEVIKGWDIGVATMKRREVSVFTCTPEYAYGKRQQGKIPANSTLVFEVELFDWTGEDVSEDKDGSIIKRVLKSGEGFENPTDDSTVEVSLVGRHEGRIFDEREVKFIIGECGDHNVIEGVEIGIRKMQKGETCRLMIKPKFAFGSEGNKEFNVPADSSVEYEITLTSCEKAKESWEMNSEEKISGAEIAKAKGTAYFKTGRFQEAIKHYKKVTSYLDCDTDFTEEQKAIAKPLMLAGHLNLAMSFLRIEDFLEAIRMCDKALEVDETSEKGLFRRGQARAGMKDWDLAKLDFAKVLEQDPNNKAAKNQVAICAHHIKQDRAKERKMYSNMFSKYIQEVEKKAKVVPTSTTEDPFASKIEHFGGEPPAAPVEGDGEGEPAKEEGGGDATALPAEPEAKQESAQPMES